MVTGNPIYDAIGTMLIGVLLIVVAVFVAVEVKAMLIGQSVEPPAQQEIREFLDARPEIARVLSLITLQLGNDVMVAVKAEMRDEAADRRGADRRRSTRSSALKEAFPEVRWSFFEPDVKSGD